MVKYMSSKDEEFEESQEVLMRLETADRSLIMIEYA